MAAVGLSTSCHDVQEQARTVVLDAGYRFSIDDFLKAAGGGRGSVVEQFLAAGMNVNAVGNGGQTALRVAAGAGHSHLVGQLLAAGAAVDQADAGGVTPLIAAAVVGDGVSVQALRLAGAQPGRVDGTGRSALAAAAAAGHAGVVELLVPTAGGSTEEVLWLACGAGHTGVIDGLLKAVPGGMRDRLDWGTLLEAAAAGGHVPALRLLSSRMPETMESHAARQSAARVARAVSKSDAAVFLDEEVRRSGDFDLAAGGISDDPPGGEITEIAVPMAGAPVAEATPIPTSMVPPAPSGGLSGARFTRVKCQTMNEVPEAIRVQTLEPRTWPVMLRDVTPDHESAEVFLAGETPRTVTLQVGDEIPGTGCIVEKLRRRRVYGDAAETVLRNVSELHFRRTATGELFKAAPDVPVLSNDSSAQLTVAGVEGLWTALEGDEFRLGSLLLRVSHVAADSIKVENRLTRETIQLPLPPLR